MKALKGDGRPGRPWEALGKLECPGRSLVRSVQWFKQFKCLNGARGASSNGLNVWFLLALVWVKTSSRCRVNMLKHFVFRHGLV